MTPEQADRVIHEARGLCWHELMLVYEKKNGITDTYRCTKNGCKYDYLNCDNGTLIENLVNPTYTDPAPFLEMLEWASEQEWWGKLKEETWQASVHKTHTDVLTDLILDRPKMVALVAEWLSEKEPTDAKN